MKIYLKCLLLAFIVLFLISPDSYTRDLFGHYDSAWFFMAGKAWMNGLKPYIDFADSKGPLLWLIYGIGYLISPYNFIGVFWLNVLSYSVVFYYVYKISFIFIKHEKGSLAVTLLMIASFFYTGFHTEIRSEDWSQLFVVYTFYRICFSLFTEKGATKKAIRETCFTIGLSLAGTFLIKYNTTIMLGIVSSYFIYALLRERNNLLVPILCIICGFVCITFPFYLYMIRNGLFNNFIQEYFTNTIQTIDSVNNINAYIHEWLYMFTDIKFILFLVICITGCIYLSRIVSKHKHFFLFSFFAFYGIAIHHGNGSDGYFCICLFFPIWACISIVDKLNTSQLKYTIIIVLLYTFCSNSFSRGYLSQTWFFIDNQLRRDYYNIAYYMSQKKNPTITYYMCYDKGHGTPVNSLPGTTYWSTQTGATTNMIRSIHQSLEGKSADFIITDSQLKPINSNDSIIKSYGYKPIYRFERGNIIYIFYTKHNLQDPPSDFHVSSMDILLKRNIFNLP